MNEKDYKGILLEVENWSKFSPVLAEGVGVNAALTFATLQKQWLGKENCKVINGVVWATTTLENLNEKMPYLSPYQIKNGLRILEEKGYIVSGFVNDNKLQRTKSYARTKKEWVVK